MKFSVAFLIAFASLVTAIPAPLRGGGRQGRQSATAAVSAPAPVASNDAVADSAGSNDAADSAAASPSSSRVAAATGTGVTSAGSTGTGTGADTGTESDTSAGTGTGANGDSHTVTVCLHYRYPMSLADQSRW